MSGLTHKGRVLAFTAVAALVLRLLVEWATRRLVHWVDEMPA